ncbi:MAG: ATP-binding protein, partial [Ruminococcus flavefaciens]|nr:ATP-binding protein [Ruminococcus flavefaciens]
IIQTVHSHTLTVVLSALSLSASGMEASELLHELQSCGLNFPSGEDIELYKDGDYTDGLMAEHLRKLLQLGRLSFPCLDILRNLSLLPSSGVLKNAFKSWLKLPTLNDVNYLAKYGFINDDTQNRKISLHPLIKEVVALETLPSVSNCHTLLDSLYYICLVHGLEVKKPQNVISSLISITKNILVDISEDYLLFLQDMFPYQDMYPYLKNIL